LIQIPGSSDRLIVEHHLLRSPQLRMAKAVLGWLQTIKLDENYQTQLKMAMTKLEPKRFYWFVDRSKYSEDQIIFLICFREKTRHFLKSPYNANIPNPYVTCLVGDRRKKTHRFDRKFSFLFRISMLLTSKNDVCVIRMSKKRMISFKLYFLFYALANIRK